MNNKKKKSGKNSAAGIAWAVLLLVIYALRRVDFQTLGRRLQWALRTGGFPVNGGMLFALCLGVIVVIIGIAAVARVARGAAGRNGDADGISRRPAAPHSHDRLSGYADGSCGELEHWKKQLDGFLEAGIIDRAEYRVLLERRRSDGSR